MTKVNPLGAAALQGLLSGGASNTTIAVISASAKTDTTAESGSSNTESREEDGNMLSTNTRHVVSMSTEPAKVPSMVGGPLPTQLQGHDLDEVEIYFRNSLVGEREHLAVIEQVKKISSRSHVLKEVRLMEKESPTLPHFELDLDYHKPVSEKKLLEEWNKKGYGKHGKKRMIPVGLFK
jgi:hypothetical protein